MRELAEAARAVLGCDPPTPEDLQRLADALTDYDHKEGETDA